MFKRLLLALGLSLAVATGVQAQITIPNTLVPGNVIRAGELNTNFSTLGTKALNRITGGTVEGNITLNTDVTIDGVDISDFLITTGEVRAQTAGTEGAPSFSRSGDTDTGFWFPAAEQIAASIEAIKVFQIDETGLWAFGTQILNGNGKIPALTSTYLASLDGSALTGLNASNIATGTLNDARLSANVPKLDAGSNAFTGSLSAAGVTSSSGLTVSSGTTSVGAVSSSGQVAMTGFRLGTSANNGYVLTTDATGVGSWQVPGVISGAVPAGLIAMFDASCPVGWSRMADWDNKMIRGGSTYVLNGGGSDTHTHTVDPAVASSSTTGDHLHTLAPVGDHTHIVDVPSTGSNTVGAHTHSSPSGDTGYSGDHSHTGTTSDAGSHTHSLAGGDVQSGGGIWVTITNTTGSSGTHNHSFGTTTNGNHRHSYGGGSTGSSGDHAHAVDPAWFYAGVAGGHYHDMTTVGNHSHTVDIASTSTEAGANIPAYTQVVFCKKDPF